MNQSTKTILTLLEQYLEANPSIRFAQALHNLNINQFADAKNPEAKGCLLRDNEPRACACALPGLPGEGHCIKRGVSRCSAKRRAAVSTERSARLVRPQWSAAELRSNSGLYAAPCRMFKLTTAIDRGCVIALVIGSKIYGL